MQQNPIHWKTKRKIEAIVRIERKKLLKNYFCSVSFIYMILFASLHYFFDKDSIFLTTFGIVIIDLIASYIYFKLFLLQSRRDGINITYEHKKLEKRYKLPLIDRTNTQETTISMFKMIILLLSYIVLSFYYLIYGNLIKKVEFMSVPNSIECVMFFISIAYFDIFFEGGIKKYLII